MQVQIKESCIGDDGRVDEKVLEKRMLIARVTHCNDIRLWISKENPFANQLINYQKRFIANGGAILRLLMSKEFETPTEEYKVVIDAMKKHGIEARFLYYYHDFSFDFLWVTNCENEPPCGGEPIDIVAKWYSGAHGKMLDTCEI